MNPNMIKISIAIIAKSYDIVTSLPTQVVVAATNLSLDTKSAEATRRMRFGYKSTVWSSVPMETI